MTENVLVGREREILSISRRDWEQGLAERLHYVRARCGFMSADHHRVRNFVVKEIPKVGKPLAPEFIGQELHLPVARVHSLLADLEKHLTFLFRNRQGEVSWAYPVTADRTPHHVAFSTGEQTYAA